MNRFQLKVRRGRPTYVQNLNVGDVVAESDGFFEVCREPEVEGQEVKLYLRRLPEGKNLKAYVYDKNSHVKLAS